MRRLALALLFVPTLAWAQAPFGFSPPQGIVIQDEGIAQGRARTLNCTGAGITCSVSAGTATINATGGSGTFTVTEVELDFGSTATAYANFSVTDAAVTATSKLLWTQSGNTPTGGQTDDSEMDPVACSIRPATGSFTARCKAMDGPVRGKLKFWYSVG